jgi:hypothetical protein
MESKQIRKVFGIRLIVMLGLFLSFGTVLPACERLCSKDFWTSANLDEMKTELACQGNVNMVNAQGNCMLHWAAFYGGRDNIEGLINRGVDANLRNRFFGESPLFWATAAASVGRTGKA